MEFRASKSRIAVVLLFAALALVRLPAATPQMPVTEIQPGMVGIGRTVFQGTRVEEFKAHILGVLSDVIGPRRDIILARLEGGPLAGAGVIAGMSGSPVYIDGRLIGAVSYALGAFSKEPIAGITPIAEMIDSASFTDRRTGAGRRARLDLPFTPDTLSGAITSAFTSNQPFGDRPDAVRLRGVTAGSSLAGFSAGQLGTLMRPIATPLAMSGFTPEVADLLSRAFGASGFLPVGGARAGTMPGEMPFDGPLKPGDAIGVNLISGDVMLGATGTVTHIDGDRVYAFGHPFFNLGPTEFPMTRAYVYTVLPSLSSSLKVSATSEVIGTMVQDRATTIAGRLGVRPVLIPVTVRLESDRSAPRTFHFEVVNDQMFTPLMTYTALIDTLSSYERQFGAATFSVKGTVAIKKHNRVSFDNVFAGEQASAGAAAYIVAPITSLLANDSEPVAFEGLDLTIASSEEPKTATLERVWLDAPRARAGETVPIKLQMRTYRGEAIMRTVAIDIPANAGGSLSLLVTDAARLTQLDQRQQPRSRLGDSVPQLIRAANRTRRNDRLYVRLLGAEAGAVVNGEQLPALPPSVLAVLEGDRAGGNFSPLQGRTLGEWEVPVDQTTVTGSRTLTIRLTPE